MISRHYRRITLSVGIWFVTSLCICGAFADEGSAQEDAKPSGFMSFDHEGVERQYVLHIPENLPANAPLVFFLHGYRGDARGYAEMGMSRVADQNQFAVVYPQGLKDYRGIPHWNARLKLSKVDDIGFLTALAKHLQERHQLNPEKTFSSGVSNGGFMSYALVAEARDVFKAAASIIGTMSGYTWEHRQTIEPTPILQISGLADEIVPVDGRMSPLGGWGGAPDQETIINFWKELNQTKTEEVEQISKTTTAYRYGQGVNNTQVWLYNVKGWGHRVPGERQMGTHSVDLVWQFLKQF
ncbi:prolyl oligopeptidase family serine peptidase [bacterium]|nr:prolyl oligopeptidase family serine peptidase [bacterium]MDC0278645.1 prolyl oligopeptidase family serine peptidase [bacterium]